MTDLMVDEERLSVVRSGCRVVPSLLFSAKDSFIVVESMRKLYSLCGIAA
jgi:hypothetical protein